MNDDDVPDRLYDEIERRALFELSEDDDDIAPDLIGSLAEPAPDGDAAESVAVDMTLGGYIDLHSRVPAFEGPDAQPYTVDVDVEEQPGTELPFAAFLVFVRWAATGAGIMDHVESGDVARGSTEEDARRAALELSLYEIKAELDAAIARRRAALED
jgi:hypothetical protein